MATVDLADAKALPSELVDRVEAGDTVEFTRRGKPVNATSFRSLTASMPPPSENTADLVRSMRDADRYCCSISTPR